MTTCWNDQANATLATAGAVPRTGSHVPAAS
jgi:hypothetical protein